MSNVKVEDDENLILGDMYPWQIGVCILYNNLLFALLVDDFFLAGS